MAARCSGPGPQTRGFAGWEGGRGTSPVAGGALGLELKLLVGAVVGYPAPPHPAGPGRQAPGPALTAPYSSWWPLPPAWWLRTPGLVFSTSTASQKSKSQGQGAGLPAGAAMLRRTRYSSDE